MSITNKLSTGDRLRIPAWSDWFMRGESYCAVVKTGSRWCHVKGERSGRKWRVALTLIGDNLEGYAPA